MRTSVQSYFRAARKVEGVRSRIVTWSIGIRPERYDEFTQFIDTGVKLSAFQESRKPIGPCLRISRLLHVALANSVTDYNVFNPDLLNCVLQTALVEIQVGGDDPLAVIKNYIEVIGYSDLRQAPYSQFV